MEFEALKAAILRTLQVYDKEVTPEADFENALGADSIDMAQILKLVEEELDISLPVKQWAELKSVGDALKLIESVKRGG